MEAPSLHTEPHRQELTSREPRVSQSIVNLGIVVDEVTPKVAAAVLRDLITFASYVGNLTRLRVVTNQPDALRSVAGTLRRVEFTDQGFDKCGNDVIVYFDAERPSLPSGLDNCAPLYKRVGPPPPVKVRLAPGNQLTLPTRPTQAVPVSQSPSSMTMPAFDKNTPSQVPMIYPWLG